MRSRIAALLASLFIAGIALFGVASPAQAAYSDCGDYYFCVWTGTNATGARYQWHYNTFIDSYRNGIRMAAGPSNHGYSFYNRTHTWVGIFDSTNCNKSPWWRSMENNQYATAQGSDWGGRVSSVQLGNAIPAGAGSSLTC